MYILKIYKYICREIYSKELALVIVEIVTVKICRAVSQAGEPEKSPVLQVKSEAICWQNYLSSGELSLFLFRPSTD